AQGRTRSLISRFENYKDSILRFAEDFNIEPTNNLSELSLRNSKVTQAVRKCFRNEQGLENYCYIQSVFDTVGKAKTKVLAFIREIYRGQASVLMRSMLGLKMQT
ncbi:MAG: transposase, partial [Sphaerochaeta sp.]|nr:transposase [Sphaerochaeta sp.]